MTTRASDDRPTRRVMATRDGSDLVVEVGSHELTLRPARTRRGGPAEVRIGAGLLYQRLLLGERAGAARPRKLPRTRRAG